MRHTRSKSNVQFDTLAAIELIAKLSRFSFAADQHRAARAREREGYPFTAALKWRKAADVFAEYDSLGDRCWAEWERIMQLPRRLADPI